MQQWDEYCERVGFGLLAEPLNAISNFSFIIAAWAAWVLAKRTDTLTPGVKVLIGLAALTGVGSMFWHTLANTWSLYLDIVPIVIFIVGFIWLYTREVMRQGAGVAVLGIGVFFLAAVLVRPIGENLHGAPSYLPALLVVLGGGVYHAVANRPSRFTLLAAFGAYCAALFFRTIDQELCHYMTIGTHWIWHSLVGLVTYLSMRSLVLSLASEMHATERADTATA